MDRRVIPLLLLALFMAVSPVQTGVARQNAQLVAICAIQGDGYTSPRVGATLRTQGVVTADFDNTALEGFFIQKANCDSSPATSDGVFVSLGQRADLVATGDSVEVLGTVAEFYGQTRLEAAPADVQILGRNHNLPAAEELNPPFENESARAYYETLEGMRVWLSSGNVVGPTDARGDAWLVRADLGIPRVFADDPAGTGEIITVGSDGLETLPPAAVGELFQGLTGVLDYQVGAYKLLLTEPPQISDAPRRVDSAPHGGAKSQIDLQINPNADRAALPDFTFGTLNLDNLFDTVDDPNTEDPVLSASEYQRKLDKLALLIRDGLGEPDFLAVQEAENETVLRHLAARHELTVTYQVVWVDGPDRRGIDVALLYNPARVTVAAFAARQGCTPLVDGLGPDGNLDVENPQNAHTCDTDGDGVLDGNRLFSRPPLVVEMDVDLGAGETLPLWVVVNHWKSKREDTRTQAYTLPRRLEQAAFVAALTEEIQAAHPGAALIVLGDLNDTIASQPLDVLARGGLWNAARTVERAQRYTYVYRGISQTLDYVLVSAALAVNRVAVQPVHLGADYPAIYAAQPGIYRASDHDPLCAGYTVLPYHAFLPRVSR